MKSLLFNSGLSIERIIPLMTTTPTVTQEQLDRCSRIYDASHNNEVFYLVENSRGDVDDEGNIIEYTVRYLKGKGLTCTCPAGNPPCNEAGFFKYAPRMCQHIRAAVETPVAANQGTGRGQQCPETIVL